MTEAVIGKLAKALRGDGVFSAWVGINDPQIAETLAREDFDAVTLDMQHGSVDLVGAARAILSVALAGKPSVVRVGVGDFASASRVADAGRGRRHRADDQQRRRRARLRRPDEVPPPWASGRGDRAPAGR